jgi:hypothetical protein
MRAFVNWAMSRAPVIAAIWPASARPCSRTARPLKRISVGSPERSTHAAASIGSAEGSGGFTDGGTLAGPEPSFHAVSAGSINVAIRPGGGRAAAIASAASPAIPSSRARS